MTTGGGFDRVALGLSKGPRAFAEARETPGKWVLLFRDGMRAAEAPRLVELLRELPEAAGVEFRITRDGWRDAIVRCRVPPPPDYQI